MERDQFRNISAVHQAEKTEDGITAFEYSNEWLQTGFAISPLALPLRKKVYIPKMDPFDGAFGVFADSLPDGWVP